MERAVRIRRARDAAFLHNHQILVMVLTVNHLETSSPILPPSWTAWSLTSQLFGSKLRSPCRDCHAV